MTSLFNIEIGRTTTLICAGLSCLPVLFLLVGEQFLSISRPIDGTNTDYKVLVSQNEQGDWNFEKYRLVRGVAIPEPGEGEYLAVIEEIVGGSTHPDGESRRCIWLFIGLKTGEDEWTEWPWRDTPEPAPGIEAAIFDYIENTFIPESPVFDSFSFDRLMFEDQDNECIWRATVWADANNFGLYIRYFALLGSCLAATVLFAIWIETIIHKSEPEPAEGD